MPDYEPETGPSVAVIDHALTRIAERYTPTGQPTFTDLVARRRRRTRRHAGAAYAVAVVAVGAVSVTTGLPFAGSSTDPQSTQPAVNSASGPEFAKLFEGYSVDYEPVGSPAELSAASALVVQGRIARVQPGRILGTSPSDPTAAPTVVVVVDVATELAGYLAPTSERQVYVEMPAPAGLEASVFDSYAPKDSDVVLYLIEAPNSEQTPIVEPDAGRPPGEPLYQLTNPQGFILQDGQSVIQVVEFAEYSGVTLQDFVPESERFPYDPMAPVED